MKVLVVDCSQINTNNSSPHLGLAYLASHVRELVDMVKTEGFFLETNKFASLAEFVEAEESFFNRIISSITDYDVAMLSTTYATFTRAMNLSRAIKDASADTKVVIGGPHASFLLESEFDFLDRHCTMFDFIVEGEGEKASEDLIRALQSGKSVDIPGVTKRENGSLIRGSDVRLIKDLNTVKEPSWDLFPLDKYAPYLRVMASRGCVFNCTFCDTKRQWSGFRYRSADNVFNELKNNVDKYGVRTFRFVDPTFTAYPKLRELCRLIIENRLEISFVAYAHVKTVNRDKLSYLKSAGCTALYYGIESGSNLILDGISKNAKIPEIERAIGLTKESGIKATGSFILGLPGDTPETMRQTVEFARELDCDIYSWHSYMPSLFDIAKDDRVRKYFDWKNLHLDMPKELVDEALENSQYEYLLDRHMITRYCQYGQKDITGYPQNYKDAPTVKDVVQAMRFALAETSMKKAREIDAVESLESFIELERSGVRA